LSEPRSERRQRRSNQQIQSEMSLILRLLAEGKEDKQIMSELNLSKATYYRYKKKVIKEAEGAYQKQRLETLALHKEILERRLTKLLGAAMQVLENPPTKNFHKIAEVAATLAISIFKLQVDSIGVITHSCSWKDVANRLEVS
jgi:ACT domain-containing protein